MPGLFRGLRVIAPGQRTAGEELGACPSTAVLGYATALLSVEVLCSQVLAGNRHGVQPGPTALGLFPGPRPGEVQGPGTKSA